MDIGPSEAETFWTAFLRKLARRGLRGVKLVVSDAHEGIKAAVSRVFSATWQRCRVHFMRNALAHAGKSGRRVVSAFIATAFAQDDAETGKAQWRKVAEQLRPQLPKLARLMDDAESDVLAFMGFPKDHWSKIHSNNPLERVNAEIKRRTEVVGIFPNEAAITRLVGAILLEQNDEWAVQRARYMTLPSWGRRRQLPTDKGARSRSLWRLAVGSTWALRDFEYRSSAHVGPLQMFVASNAVRSGGFVRVVRCPHRRHASVRGRRAAAIMMSVRSVPGRPSGKRARTRMSGDRVMSGVAGNRVPVGLRHGAFTAPKTGAS
jgi:putative transposase